MRTSLRNFGLPSLAIAACASERSGLGPAGSRRSRQPEQAPSASPLWPSRFDVGGGYVHRVSAPARALGGRSARRACRGDCAGCRRRSAGVRRGRAVRAHRCGCGLRDGDGARYRRRLGQLPSGRGARRRVSGRGAAPSRDADLAGYTRSPAGGSRDRPGGRARRRASRCATTRRGSSTSQSPTILVPIDGEPVLREIAGLGLLRVVNTRALILQDKLTNRYFLYVAGYWLEAPTLEGRWARSAGAAHGAGGSQAEGGRGGLRSICSRTSEPASSRRART